MSAHAAARLAAALTSVAAAVLGVPAAASAQAPAPGAGAPTPALAASGCVAVAYAVLLDTTAVGVAPELAARATARLAAATRARGYRLLARDGTTQLAGAAPAAEAVPAAGAAASAPELAALARTRGAQRALHASVVAQGDDVAVCLTVAGADGASACFVRVAAPGDLERTVDDLAAATLPAPMPADCVVTGAAAAPPAAAATAAPGATSTAGASPGWAAPMGPRLALQTEGAVGVTRGSFYNQLVGARLDYAFSPEVTLGGYLGYVNLKGKGGRAHDVLVYAQLQYCVPLGRDGRAFVPLRFASGYLPNNGPVVRAATGLGWALTPRVDLVAEFLAPMVWLTHNEMLLSMNAALELSFSL